MREFLSPSVHCALRIKSTARLNLAMLGRLERRDRGGSKVVGVGWVCMWTVNHDICIYIYKDMYIQIYIYIYTVYLVISWILKVNRNVHTCCFFQMWSVNIMILKRGISSWWSICRFMGYCCFGLARLKEISKPKKIN